MDIRRLKRVLRSLTNGEITIDDALNQLRHLPYEDIGFARIDHHRTLRHGIPEVIYAKGKEIEEIKAIASSILKNSKRLLITKANEAVYRGVKPVIDEHRLGSRFFNRSGVIIAGEEGRKRGRVLVVSAGTSDIPIAEEASLTASFLGSNVEGIYDVGVAGLHRLIDISKRLHNARVIVVVAGMEGALPSVIGGMIDKPVIAVPTSVGYGTGMGGLTALFAMLNSCVPGVAVMNIDNGFGAGVLAHRINTI
ncbi:MAG: nickel pincer cofactor biosynthesis protein LarB [Thermodesulfovibrionia bacterium]